MQRRLGTFPVFESAFERETSDLGNRIRRLLDEPIGRMLAEPFATAWPQTMGWNPAVEVAETPAEFTLTAELPGMGTKDIHIEFDDGVLTIQGEKRDEREERKDSRYYLWERTYGAFRRSFTFSTPVNPEKVTAEFRDGLLTIRLPKSTEPKTRGRRIEIQEKTNGKK
jgi:HSP20 family protein